jgi:hypothetical protein
MQKCVSIGFFWGPQRNPRKQQCGCGLGAEAKAWPQLRHIVVSHGFTLNLGTAGGSAIKVSPCVEATPLSGYIALLPLPSRDGYFFLSENFIILA